MDMAIQIFALVFTILAIITGGFMCIVHPIWGIVDAAVSKTLSGGAKATIIILTIVLLGPIMTFFYALMGSKSPAFRKVTITASIIFVVSLGGMFGTGAYIAATAPAMPTPDAIVDAQPSFTP